MRILETPQHAELVLLGFRNELARARTLSFMEDRKDLFDALPRDLTLPHTLLAQVDLEIARGLEAELTQLGAFVRVTPQAAYRSPGAAAPAIPIFMGSAPRESRLFVVAKLAALLVRVGLPLLLLFAGIAFLQSSFGGARMRFPAGYQMPRPNSSADGADVQLQHAVSELVRQKKFETAIARLNEAKAATSDSGRIATQIDHVYQQWARSEIDAGHLEIATHAIEEALSIRESSEALSLAAEIHSKKGDWDAARAKLEKALERGNKDPKVRLQLSEIYRRLGKQTEAVAMLDRAREVGAGGTAFEQLREVIVREQEAESDFTSLSSPHFRVSFAQDEDRAAARRIIDELERAYHSVGHKLGVYPDHRVPVVLYSAEDFQRATRSPDWAGGLYDGRIKVPIRGLQAGDPHLAGILRHEYAHVLVQSIAGERCPVWLNEGVAMWAQEERDGEQEEVARALVSNLGAFRLTQLEGSLGNLPPRHAAVAYSQGYLAVRYLVHRYRELALRRLLASFARGASTTDALRETLDLEVATLEEDLGFGIGK